MSTFNGFSAATTPVPDGLFDELPKLSGSELKALLYLIRRSGGDPVAVALDEFYECGLYTPTSASRALKLLEKRGYIVVSSPCFETRYALRWQEVTA